MAINPWLRAAGPAASTILRSGRVPDIRQFPIPGNFLLRRFGTTLDSNPAFEQGVPPEEELPLPPIPPEPETVAPVVTTNTGASGAPGSQNQDGESPEMLNALREFQANLRGRHMTTEPQQQPLSVLDMLRKRMANAMENEQAQRISDLGTALLASRSPNFFTALGEGLAAQEAGSRTRMDQLRQIADLERQQRALDVEEARRQEELRIREEEQRINAPLRAAQTRYYLARAEADPTGVAFTRAENAARGAASAAADRAVQAENVRRSRVVPTPLPPLTAAEAATLRDTVYRQSLIERGFTPPAGAAAPTTTGAPATPSVRVDASGREIR